MKTITNERKQTLIDTCNVMINREVTSDYSANLREVALIALSSLTGNREAQPVNWGSPKTIGQLIGQLQTLDPAMETTALQRMPADFRDGKSIRQVPLDISFERLDGQWLAPYKGDGRKVLAFWAKADHREEEERGELFTAPPAPAVPDELVDQICHAAAGIYRQSDDDKAQAIIDSIRVMLALPKGGK